MRLYSIVLKDIFRRRTKLVVGVLGVVIAASAIVAVITTFTAATDSLYDESSKFGANIIVRPETNSIPLIEGSTSVGSISTGENYIDESKISNIYNSCGTTFDATTGNCIQGACVDYPNENIPYTESGGILVMAINDIITSHKNTVIRG